MALFPFFIDIQEKRGLIIGCGKDAQEKMEKLLPYCSRLQLIQRPFQESDLDEMPAFVVAASEDREENHRIAQLCRARRILVNVADDPKYCDFMFPSLIRKGNLSIGISTGGTSPSTGVLLKKKIQSQIPDQMEEILDFLQEKRPVITQALTCKKKRWAFFQMLSEICMDKKRPLTEEEFQTLLNESLLEENTDNC